MNFKTTTYYTLLLKSIVILIQLNFINADTPKSTSKVIFRVNNEILKDSDFIQLYNKRIFKNKSLKLKDFTNEIVNILATISYAKILNINIKYSDFISFLNKQITTHSQINNIQELVKVYQTQNKHENLYTLYFLYITSQYRYKLMNKIFENYNISIPSTKEISKYYNENKSNFYEEAKYKISHIELQFKNNGKLEEVSLKEDKIEKIYNTMLENISNNSSNKNNIFNQFVLKYSEDINSKYNFGNLGWFTKRDLKHKYSTENILKIINLNKNEISNIIYDSSFCSIVRMQDKREKKYKTLKESSGVISQYIRLNIFTNNKLKLLLKEFKKKSYIYIDKNYINYIRNNNK